MTPLMAEMGRAAADVAALCSAERGPTSARIRTVKTRSSRALSSTTGLTVLDSTNSKLNHLGAIGTIWVEIRLGAGVNALFNTTLNIQRPHHSGNDFFSGTESFAAPGLARTGSLVRIKREVPQASNSCRVCRDPGEGNRGRQRRRGNPAGSRTLRHLQFQS